MLDPHLTGGERVREVFARVARGDDGAADLYAEDAVVAVPGMEIVGREAIREFYRGTIDALHPKPEVQEVLQSGDGSLFIAVAVVPTDQGNMDAIDLFELGDAGIRRLTIFPRGASLP